MLETIIMIILALIALTIMIVDQFRLKKVIQESKSNMEAIKERQLVLMESIKEIQAKQAKLDHNQSNLSKLSALAGLQLESISEDLYRVVNAVDPMEDEKGDSDEKV